MQKAPTVFIADDQASSRVALKLAFHEAAPEFLIIEHSQAATLLDKLIEECPQVLVMDRAFVEDQDVITTDFADAAILAFRIRREYPQLAEMSILVYSQYGDRETMERITRDSASQGIWFFPKLLGVGAAVKLVCSLLQIWPANASSSDGTNPRSKPSTGI